MTNEPQPADLSQFSLDGKRAIVTGASRGIGAAIALKMAQSGADVALVARTPDDLESVAADIRRAGRRTLPLQANVCDLQAVASAVERAWEELGPIDVLVNAAGGPLFQSPILDVQEEGWQRVLNLNLTSVLQVCQEVGRRMVQRGSGSIITLASILPTRAWPAIASYSAAKAGVLSLTQAMAVEWGRVGVRVNAICPGWIGTTLNKPYLENPAAYQAAIEAVPLGRWGEASDITGTVIWLASDASRYVTGSLIPVDGGLSVGMSQHWQEAMRLE